MLSDSVRTDLIFLSASGSIARDGDCTIIRTPDNPTYWWGNALVFDAPPRPGDLARWSALFARHIRAHQPASRHTTFGWNGDERGEVAPFLDAGFTLLESVVMTATIATLRPAPHRDDDAVVRTLVHADWDALHALLVETRDDGHSEAGYAEFATQRIAGWRALAEPARGAVNGKARGAWFGAWCDGASGPRLVSALGIVADENDVARRVYASLGFAPSGWQRGLELRG